VITIGCTTTPPTKPLSKTEAALEQSKTIYWKTHNSSLGFRIDLPSHYLVVTREELKENPDLIEAMFETARGIHLKSADKNAMEQMKIMAQSGVAEYYYNQNYPGANINVVKCIGKIPETDAESRKTCEKAALVSGKIMGVTIKVDECELRNVAGLNALYSVTNTPGFGAFERIKQVQYAIQKSSSVQLNFAATSGNQVFEIVKKEFEEIMESLKFR
jgi:hypothetical protein